MDKTLMLDFNTAYGHEPTADEQQTINDLLAVWAKLDTAAKKNPSLIRKGIVFGLGLAEGIRAGKIQIRKARAKRTGTKPEKSAE